MPSAYKTTGSAGDAESEDRAPSQPPSVIRLLYSAAEDGVYLVLRPTLRTGALGNALRGPHGERELTAAFTIVGLDEAAKRQWRKTFAGREAELRGAVIAVLGPRKRPFGSWT